MSVKKERIREVFRLEQMDVVRAMTQAPYKKWTFRGVTIGKN